MLLGFVEKGLVLVGEKGASFILGHHYFFMIQIRCWEQHIGGKLILKNFHFKEVLVGMLDRFFPKKDLVFFFKHLFFDDSFL